MTEKRTHLMKMSKNKHQIKTHKKHNITSRKILSFNSQDTTL